MTDGLKVRVATVEDVHGVMDLALLACASNGFLRPDPEKLLRGIYPALLQENSILGVIGPVGGPMEAAVLLTVQEHWYSTDRFVEERSVFVHPEHRAAKKGHVSALMGFSKSVADNLHLPLLIGVLATDGRVEGKTRLYRRFFGEPSGAYFLYNAKTGSFASGDNVV